jgi:HlyD family secretion protein
MRSLVAVALAALVVGSCGQRAQGPADSSRSPGATVLRSRTAIVTPSHIAQQVELTGAVAPRHVAVVAAQQAGRVESLSVREGDLVKAGAIIGTIDASNYAAGATSASGAALAATASAQEALADIANADAAHDAALFSRRAAAATLRNAREHAARMDSLYAQGAVSRELRDDAVTAADQAEAAYAGADAAIARARATAAAARAHADMALAQTVAAQGQAQQANISLEQTSIIAPFDGVVTKRWLDIGAYANPGTSIVTIESNGALEIDLSVPEEDVAGIVPGARIAIVVDALSGRTISALVRSLVPSALDNSHQYAAKLDVPPTRGLLPGMFVRSQVAANMVSGLGIPPSAVTMRAGQSGVFLINGRRAAFQPVTVEASDERMAIVSGVAEGARVALDPSGLQDGEAIATSSSTEAMRQ